MGGTADHASMDDEIRRIVREHGRVEQDVSTLARGADLYDAGMTSHASVSVMLALEDRFDLEFPEHMLVPSVFQSIAAISRALSELRQTAPAAAPHSFAARAPLRTPL